MIGKRFGRLTVIAEGGRTKTGMAMWKCECECGNTTIVRGAHLRSGRIKSCGCFRQQEIGARSTTHGKSKTRLYYVWRDMRRRCYYSKDPYFADYGGRGIAVCEEWRNSFETFNEWAIANGYKPDANWGECTIDRIDVNGDYCQENCRWITIQEQQKNRRPRKRQGVINET